ncbi:junction-mediating and -regulatory protein-like [Tachypleus tridentatus]|uniref:junction-mediating and -regulatory protein-like n=1 Tax=Tachypleus tridentatus TaxID=6853 RepID=UPI003FCF1E26
MEEDTSLEDWVTIKDDLFGQEDVANRKYLDFIAEWNEIEKKLAITCTEGTRKASDQTCKSHACMLSIASLQNIHQQLSLVNTKLNDKFPKICNKSGFLSHLFGVKSTKIPVREIEAYLYTALDVCGKKMLFSLLFEEEEDPLMDYEENVNEFRLRAHESLVNKAFHDLKEILELRERAESLLELATVYTLEDEVVANISVALSELYNFQLKPFLELRELSTSKTTSAQLQLEDQDLGDKVKQQAAKDLEEWKNQYFSVTEAIQHLYQDYYRKTVDLLSGQRKRMLEDKNKFGKSTFEIQALPRLQKLDVSVSKERLKLLNAVKASHEYQRDKIQQQLEKLQFDKNWKEEAFMIESAVYEAQISVFSSRLDILQEQECLFKKQLSIIQKATQDELDVGIFHDAVEYFDEDAEEEQVVQADPRIAKLKAKLNSVYRKRATIRNHKKACISHLEKKKQKVFAEKEHFGKHHSAQMKRTERQKQDEVAKEKMREERKKTLKRLKTYRQKCQQSDISSSSLSPNVMGEVIHVNAKDDTVAEYKLCERNGEKPTVKLNENDELPLPPPPPVDGLYFSQEQQNLPLPPPPGSDDDNQFDSGTAFCSTLQDPDSETKSYFLPPPPPPPLPLSHTLILSSETKKQKTDGIATKKSDSLLSGISGLDLNELLAVRNNLRKPIPSIYHLNGEKRANLYKPRWKSSDSDFSTVLHATLARIRNVTCDSDLSNDSDSSTEFE